MDSLTQEQQSLWTERIESIKASNEKLDEMIKTTYNDQHKSLPYAPLLLRIYPQQKLKIQDSGLDKLIETGRNNYCKKWNQNSNKLEKCYKFYNEHYLIGASMFQYTFKYKYSATPGTGQDE